MRNNTLDIVINAVTDNFHAGVEKTKTGLVEVKDKVISISASIVKSTETIVDFGSKFNQVVKSNINLAADFAREIGGVKGGLLGLLTLKDAGLGDLFGKFTVRAGALGLQVKQAKDFESAFADVKKVVEGTDQELSNLEQTIKRLASKEIPLPLADLSTIAASGGQLGIATSQLDDYIRTVSQASVAFDILPDSAGQAVGGLTNIFQEPLSQIKLLLDQINVLGDTTASTERDILEVMRFVGGSGKNFGLLKEETAALVATLLSLEKPPEIVRTALNGLFSALTTGEMRGATFNESLQAMGLSADQLAADIQANPTKALLNFLETLGKFDNLSQSKLLSGLFGLGTDAPAIGELAGSLDALKANLAKVGDQSAVSGSMLRTFEARAGTLDNKIRLATNATAIFAVEVGNPFLAPLKSATDMFHGFMDAMARLTADHPAISAFVRIISLTGSLSLLLNSLAAIAPVATAAVVRFSAALAGSALGVFVTRSTAALVAVTLLTGVIGGVNSLLITSGIAFAMVGYNAVLAFRAAGAGATVLAATITGVRTTVLSLVGAFGGGWIAALLIAISSLVVAWTNVKDKIIEVGSTNATVSEFVAAMWQVTAGSVTGSIGSIIDYLGSLIDKLLDVGDTNKKTADKAADDWKISNLGVVNSLKLLSNLFKGTFDFITDYMSIRMTEFQDIIGVRLDNAVKLAKAAGKDISAALRLDFSFLNTQAALIENAANAQAVFDKANTAIKSSAGNALTTDYVENAIKADQAERLKAQQATQNQVTAEAERQRIELQAKLAGNPPGLTANLGSGEDKYTALYRAAEQKYQLPPYLVEAVAQVESAGGKNAGLSSAGALGVMQLMPETARALGVKDRNNAAQSIEGGAKLLRELMDTFNNDVSLAVAAYNSRPKTVKQAAGDFSKLPRETQAYVPKVLGELDKLQNNSKAPGLVEQFNALQTLIKNQRDAVGIAIESRIDNRLKTAETTADNTIQTLKNLKEQGKIGINDYYRALTEQQQIAVNANIEAVKSRLAENQRLNALAQQTAKPEELPTIAAGFAAKNASLNTELQALQLKLAQIKPTNLIDQSRELKALDDVVQQVKIKLAELRGETVNDPIAIKARLELENADIIAKLKQAGQSDLAGQYINTLSATEQAGVIQSDIGQVQQRTQAQETRLNIQQQSGSITQFQAQQQLKQLYQESAAEIDAMANSLSALGENTGLEDLKVKALDARNAAGQLRVALPSIGTQLIDAGQSAGIDSMTNSIIGLSNGTEKAGQAFANFGLSVVKALQQIAAQQLAKKIIGSVIEFASLAIGGGKSGQVGSKMTFSNGLGASGWATGGLIADTGSIGYQNKAVGGLITGPGTETSDSINTAMTPGSFIIKAASVKKVGLPALNALIQRADDIRTGKVPVKVSNNEFEIPPSIVKKYGTAFFTQLNNTGTMPPASIQRAYAAGGMVGSLPGNVANSESLSAPARDTINITVPVNINQTDGKPANDNNKLDPAKMGELSKQLKDMVSDKIMQEQRPGGLLYRK